MDQKGWPRLEFEWDGRVEQADDGQVLVCRLVSSCIAGRPAARQRVRRLIMTRRRQRRRRQEIKMTPSVMMMNESGLANRLESADRLFLGPRAR